MFYGRGDFSESWNPPQVRPLASATSLGLLPHAKRPRLSAVTQPQPENCRKVSKKFLTLFDDF